MKPGNSKPQRLDLFYKACIFSAALLLLSGYYYLYLIKFEEGHIEKGLGLFKIFVLVFVYLIILSPAIKTKYSYRDLLFFVFLLFSVSVFLLKRFVWAEGNLLFLNMIICSAPFYIFNIHRNSKRIEFFFESCLIVMVLQVILETIVFLTGSSLWLNKAFVGGLGNPNSFGVVCNILICYVLFLRRPSFFSLLSSGILAYGVLMTNSLLSILLLSFTFLIWMARNGPKYIVIFSATLALLMPFIYRYMFGEHFFFKLKSLFGLTEGYVSSSVSGRIEIHKYFISQLDENFFRVLFIGYPGSYYYAADSQLLSYIGSFGLMLSIIFFIFVVLEAIDSYRTRTDEGFFSMMVILIFLVTFLSNRIMDYYPVPFFLFLAIGFSHYFRGGASN